MNLDTPDGLANSVEWQTNFINLLNDGGIWVVPRSNAVYTINKSDKTVQRDTPDEAVDRVFKEMGWTIL